MQWDSTSLVSVSAASGLEVGQPRVNSFVFKHVKKRLEGNFMGYAPLGLIFSGSLYGGQGRIRNISQCGVETRTNHKQRRPNLDMCPKLARGNHVPLVPPVTRFAHDDVEVIDGRVDTRREAGVRKGATSAEEFDVL
jgi:hypothetical protein